MSWIHARSIRVKLNAQARRNARVHFGRPVTRKNWWWMGSGKYHHKCTKNSSFGIIGFLFNEFSRILWIDCSLLKLDSCFNGFLLFDNFYPLCIWHDLRFTQYTLSCFKVRSWSYSTYLVLFCFGWRFTRDSRFNCLSELSIWVSSLEGFLLFNTIFHVCHHEMQQRIHHDTPKIPFP